MITNLLHDQTEIRGVMMIVSNPIKDYSCISFERCNYLSHKILVLIILMVVSNDPGPALEGTGHVMRMSIFASKFRNVYLVIYSSLLLLPPLVMAEVSDPLSLTLVLLVVLWHPRFFPHWPRLFFFFFGEAASVVNPSSSVVYMGLVTSMEPFKGRVVPPWGSIPVAVTEEVAKGMKGLAEADRLLLVCPNYREESLLLSSRWTLRRSSFSKCLRPCISSCASVVLMAWTVYLARFPIQVGISVTKWQASIPYSRLRPAQGFIFFP